LTRQEIGSPSAQRVAYHEAGHAVVGHVLGKTIEYVTIEPALTDVAGQTFGHTKWLDLDQGSPDPMVLVALAGSLAEERQMGDADDWARAAERRQAEHVLLMAKRLGRRDGPPTITPGEETRAAGMVQDCWPAVQALATALMIKPTLGRRLVAEIVKRASRNR
jgi:hypothetical protein